MKSRGNPFELRNEGSNLLDNFTAHICQYVPILFKFAEDRSPAGGLIADCLRIFRKRTYGGYPLLDLIIDILRIRKLFPWLNDLVYRTTNLVELGRAIRATSPTAGVESFSASLTVHSRSCDIPVARTYKRYRKRHHVPIVHNGAVRCNSRVFGHHVGVDGRSLQIADQLWDICIIVFFLWIVSHDGDPSMVVVCLRDPYRYA